MENLAFYKQSSLNAIFYYIRRILESINLIWLFPLILDAEQIGIYQLVTSSAYIISYVIQLGIPHSIVKFFPEYKMRKSSFMTFIIFISLLTFIIFTTLFFLFRNDLAVIFKKKSNKTLEYFNLMLLTSFFLYWMIIFKAWLKCIYKSVIPSFIQNVLIFLLITISAIFYFFKIIDFRMLIYSVPLIFFSGLIGILIYLKILNELNFSFDKYFFQKQFLKKFSIYNFCAIIGDNSFSIVTKLDTIMISSLIGLKFNGIYAIIIAIPKLIEIPRKAVKQLSIPLISNLIVEEKWEDIKKTYKSISLNQLVIGIGIFLIIYSNLENIIFLIPNKFMSSNIQIKEASKYVLLYLSIAKLIDTTLGSGNDIILMSNFFWFNLVSLIILASTSIIFNYVMIPIWGITGASAATTLSCFFYYSSICLFIKFKTNLFPFSINMLKCILIGIFSYCFCKIIPDLKNKGFDIIIRMITVFSIYFYLIIYFNVSEEFAHMIKKKLRKFIT